MRMLKLWVFLFFSFSFAQENFKFYIEIPNTTFIPAVSQKNSNEVTLSFNAKDLTKLFSQYAVYKFEKAFPEARTPKLQTVYYIECNEESLNDILMANYSLYFPNAEKVPEYKLLYTPNDYYLFRGYSKCEESGSDKCKGSLGLQQRRS